MKFMYSFSDLMNPSTYPYYSQTGYKTSPFYLISLEAWRRGLTVTFSGDIKNFTVSSPENSRIFSKSMVLDPEMGFKTHEICENKDETKKYLAKADIPVPRGRRFSQEITDEEIIRCAGETGYPLVLKPTNGYMGKGVFSNVPDETSLRELLVHVRRELQFPDVMVEERIEGLDYRIFVLGDHVLAALKRMPANVSGNGRDTIKELIRKKNHFRAKNPHFARKTIKVDSEVLHHVKRAGYHMNSIPRENEMLLLRNNGNISTGGDSIDATEELPQHVQNTAIQAVKTIPGLKHAGVDLIFDHTRPDSPAVVIEINSMAEIGGHLHPGIGKGRDIPSALIDHYFPESTGAKQNHRMVFYDPYILKNSLMSDPKTKITLPALPSKEMVRREITLTGRVQGVGFRRWAEKQATKMNLSGYIKNQGRNSVHIVVAGEAEQVRTFEALCKTGPDNARIDKISLKDYEEAVIFGFSIIRKDNVLLDKFRRIPKAILRRMVKFKKRIS